MSTSTLPPSLLMAATARSFSALLSWARSPGWATARKIPTRASGAHSLMADLREKMGPAVGGGRTGEGVLIGAASAGTPGSWRKRPQATTGLAANHPA